MWVESLGTVSYSPSIVTMAVSVAVCEIFSVKEWRDLENQVRGRSMSLNMAPFDRPYPTFYWSAIANIALSCTIFKFFGVERYNENRGWRSLNVIESGTIRKLGYSFLFAFHSNYGSILYCFRDKAKYWSKIATFYTHLD